MTRVIVKQSSSDLLEFHYVKTTNSQHSKDRPPSLFFLPKPIVSERCLYHTAGQTVPLEEVSKWRQYVGGVEEAVSLTMTTRRPCLYVLRTGAIAEHAFGRTRMAIVQGGRYVLLSMFHGIGNADDDARVNTYTESILPEGSLSTDFLLDGRNLDERTSKLFRSIENTSEKRQSRKLLTVYSTIQEAANELDVPVAVVNCAFKLYSQCFTRMHIRGKRSEVIVSSCLYLACRMCSCYRLLSEICDIVLADTRKVTRLSQVILSE